MTGEPGKHLNISNKPAQHLRKLEPEQMEGKEKQMCLRSEIQGFPLERVRSISLQFHTFLGAERRH